MAVSIPAPQADWEERVHPGQVSGAGAGLRGEWKGSLQQPRTCSCTPGLAKVSHSTT